MEKIVLPEIGDDIKSGVVIAIQKNVGDSVSEGDILIEVETDKAAFPVNSPFSGEIKNLLIKEGDELEVGGVIAELEVEGGSSPAVQEAATQEENKDEVEQQKESVTEAAKEAVEEIKEDETKAAPVPDSPSPATQEAPPSNLNVHASPATRKLARELGVDLNLVEGTERGGRISIDNLKSYVKSMASNPGGGASNLASGSASGFAPRPLPDFSIFGEVEEKPASNLRKTIAQHISYSYSTIPHVHQSAEVDLSRIELFQKEYKNEFKEKGSSLSVTVFIIKALALALKKFPDFNSSYDAAKNVVHYKKYFNIGVAVDTPSGLIVPVIKNVDRLDLFDIGKQLVEIAKATRERTVDLADLKGACTTVSNLGGIGGSYFNPIINSPEVSILGVARTKVEPRYEDEEWVPKNILPMVLGYDHRVIDGADGARFVTYLKSILEKPEKILMGV